MHGAYFKIVFITINVTLIDLVYLTYTSEADFFALFFAVRDIVFHSF